MTDEQLGRAWCAANDRAPVFRPESDHLGRVYWWTPRDVPTHALPAVVFDRLVCRGAVAESDAYAAVGAALRELERQAEEIRAVLGEVTT